MGNEIREIQQTELILLKEFKRICEKYRLRYFAIGGTCIGAVRHKGFIPWDDDIDVAMPFQDYKKFRRVAREELPVGVSLYMPESHQHWCGNYMKLLDDSTTFIEKSQIRCENDYTGIYMDIMPIYGMPKGKVKQYMASVVCDFLILLNGRQRTLFHEQDSKLRKLVWMLNLPIRKYGSYNYYLKLIEKIFGRYSFKYSDKIIFGWRKRPGQLHKNYTYQNVFYYEDFKEMKMFPFEDTNIAVPCGYDRYLTMDFGDYMKLPPKGKRVTRHEAVLIDLHKSYKEYSKEGIPQ